MTATPDLTSPKPAEGAAPQKEAALQHDEAARQQDQAAAGKPRGAVSFVQERFKGLVAEYGPLLFVVYFSIFGLVFVGSALAIQMGFEVRGAAATAGIWTAAYVFTKVLQPLRIAATIALTPVFAAVLRRLRSRTPDLAPEAAEEPESAPGRKR